jgi:hypothetical protein
MALAQRKQATEELRHCLDGVQSGRHVPTGISKTVLRD